MSQSLTVAQFLHNTRVECVHGLASVFIQLAIIFFYPCVLQNVISMFILIAFGKMYFSWYRYVYSQPY